MADHIFLVLGWVEFGQTQRWVREEIKLLSAAVGDIAPLESGWLGSLLERFSIIDKRGADDLFRSIEDKIEGICAPGTGRERGLRVRLAHLASHIGNRFVWNARESAFVQQDLVRAENAFHRSIARRERVLREMQREPAQIRTSESFTTLCQGHADNAHQYRGLFECLYFSIRSRDDKDLPELAIKLYGAHRLHEAKWGAARLNRGPSERLPNMFRASLPWLATGRVLKQVMENRPSLDKLREQIDQLLGKEASRLLKDYRQEGEIHARESQNDEEDVPIFRDEQPLILEKILTQYLEHLAKRTGAA